MIKGVVFWIHRHWNKKLSEQELRGRDDPKGRREPKKKKKKKNQTPEGLEKEEKSLLALFVPEGLKGRPDKGFSAHKTQNIISIIVIYGF